MPSSLLDYEVICTIGSGSYGICQKIRRKRDGKVLVWKEMDYGEMTEAEKQLLVSEVNLLRELKHENIVRYYDRIVDRPRTRLYMIMEYCEGGDLSTLISSLKKNGGHCEEDFVWRICVQTVHALKECHSRSSSMGKAVLHRDLKPANVFLDADRNVKLGDFGLARVLNHDTSFAKTFVGTPYYMSPELMNCMSYNEKSDIWSLGCLLYELCALRPPFMASCQNELATKVRLGRFARLPLRYSNALNSMISLMLQVEEDKRPSVETLAEHPHIIKHDPTRHPRPCTPTLKSSVERASRDEGYESHMRTLRLREEEVERRERALNQRSLSLDEKDRQLTKREKTLEEKDRQLSRLGLKEKELKAREKTAELREKIALEKITKAERLMSQAEMSASPLGLSPASDAVGSTSNDALVKKTATSCLTTLRPPDSPKKHVSFHVTDKENQDPARPTQLYSVESQLENDHLRHMNDLKERLRKAEVKSLDLRRTDTNTRFQRAFIRR